MGRNFNRAMQTINDRSSDNRRRDNDNRNRRNNDNRNRRSNNYNTSTNTREQPELATLLLQQLQQPI